MAEEAKRSVFKATKLHCDRNSVEHHTSPAPQGQLLVRRGRPFRLTLELSQGFNQRLHPLTITAATGPQPSETRGTKCCLRIPPLPASPSAKAAWKMELDGSSSVLSGVLQLVVTPPAHAPVGEYSLTAELRRESVPLGRLVLLFNPWCPDDDVFLNDEEKRAEYVMNEKGVIYNGAYNYISSMKWDYGQFEDKMVDICLKLLDMNHKHKQDPAKDVSARGNPVYVGRLVSAMINSEDDHGVLEGQWSGPYLGGMVPTHWSGSYDILKKWYDSGCRPVKYGQCWVFAAVMCSVMRFLGIPCRVVTNYSSAHDTDGNLTIDEFYADYGVREKPSPDSVWNFHVWVEAWMRRPDLDPDGKFDGWQVLDPTPQETSGGLYCCGPAPVAAIRLGRVDLKYDCRFVFAEVNADCVAWLVKADGTQVKIWTDPKEVGKFISTKSVGSATREDITGTYKHAEGTDEERAAFRDASTRDATGGPEEEEEEEKPEGPGAGTGEDRGTGTAGTGAGTGADAEIPPQLTLRFEEVTKPENGKDVKLKLAVTSRTSVQLQLSINISVQAMKHNGTAAANIQSEVREDALQPGKDLSVPVLVPFLSYATAMLGCGSMKVVALVSSKQERARAYMAQQDVVLADPPISLTVNGEARVNREVVATIVFMNPVNVTLRNCTMTLSGSGLLQEQFSHSLPDLKPSSRFLVKFSLVPLKSGTRTLALDFDCSFFRDVKAWCKFDVLP